MPFAAFRSRRGQRAEASRSRGPHPACAPQASSRNRRSVECVHAACRTLSGHSGSRKTKSVQNPLAYILRTTRPNRAVAARTKDNKSNSNQLFTAYENIQTFDGGDPLRNDRIGAALRRFRAGRVRPDDLSDLRAGERLSQRLLRQAADHVAGYAGLLRHASSGLPAGRSSAVRLRHEEQPLLAGPRRFDRHAYVVRFRRHLRQPRFHPLRHPADRDLQQPPAAADGCLDLAPLREGYRQLARPGPRGDLRRCRLPRRFGPQLHAASAFGLRFVPRLHAGSRRDHLLRPEGRPHHDRLPGSERLQLQLCDDDPLRVLVRQRRAVGRRGGRNAPRVGHL